jgi:hypothetical protein
MSNCLELTIYSAHRESGTSIGKAMYRLKNSTTIFANKIAVKSCTMYNTVPNININRSTLTFLQTGGLGNDSLGLVQCTIEPGHYTGGNLAVVLQESMNNVLTQPSAAVSVTFNPVTHKLHFTFDEIYVYNYAPVYEELYYSSPGGFIVWQFKPTSGSTIIMGSTFAAGNYTLDSWLKYCSDVLTADAKEW